MQTFNLRVLTHAGACVLCFVIGWIVVEPLSDTEFGGGTLTGPLLTMSDWGWLLFAVSAIGVFFLRRAAAAMALVACVLSSPAYLYLTAPGLFRRVFPGEYTVPLQSDFVWNTWAIAGMAVALLTAWIGVIAVMEDRATPTSAARRTGR